jgi:GNAT superfamily N-acetyltransferase
VSTPGIAYRLLDGRAAAGLEDDLLALLGEVCGSADKDGAGKNERARLVRVHRRQPGFVLAAAWHGGYLVGFAAGMPLRASTSWWRGLTTPLPEGDTEEYPGRTFALTDLAVRAAWRRQGVGTALHDLVLDGRTEERATLTAAPGASAAQSALRAWGWRKVARARGEGPGREVLDVLVTSL